MRAAAADASHASRRFGWRLEPRLPRALIGLLVPLGAMVLWAVAARREWVPPQILPAPDEVWAAFSDLWTSGDLQHDTAISLLRVIEGSAIGVAAGLMLGTGLGLSRGMEAYVRPLFSALAQIPALGWLPLMMLLVGIGEPLKVVIIALAATVPVTFNTMNGIRAVPLGYFEIGRVFCYSRWQLLRSIVLPAALPPIFVGVRYGITHAWLALVAVELLASSEGLGYLLVWGRQLFQLDVVIASMAVIGLIGFALDRALAMIEQRLQRWKETA
ncbi:MAG TPA: ABC transporter permease [Acetobacteraceae bacterium]|jgi:sulfonate transport system permease protein